MCEKKNNINKKFENYGIFTIGPLERNSGITFGNMLRRILLNSIKSIGITEIKYVAKDQNIDKLNTQPEFQELILEFSENIKNLVFIENENQKKQKTIEVLLEIQKQKRFTAQDLKIPPEIKIVNSNHYLGTNTIFENIEIQVSLGYVDEINKKGKDKNNLITLNSNNFNPIQRVNYKVEKIINIDKLNEQIILEIWTNGSILPKNALVKAINICSNTLQLIKEKL
uniref:Plastid-encoded RNA polymerase subunit alpha n=1 Tax=Eutreptia sp. CCAC 1914B TaxID=2979827 RepID=A0A977K7W6_9EUGL|nr:RNA polymerase subunit alpha [Eutreptia sp. CCAC 1914B]